MTPDQVLDHGLTVIKRLAEDGRHVLTRWRAHLILRQEIDPLYKADRARRVVSRLEKEDLIRPIDTERRAARIFEVSAPYAKWELNPLEVFAEAYYGGFYCYGTAFELHQLTDQRARTLHMLLPKQKPASPRGFADREELDQARHNLSIPVGSRLEDWRAFDLPSFIWIDTAGDHGIRTHKTKDEWLFGWETIERGGVPLRCANIERTLIDGLRRPKYCGGLNEVFRGWVRAKNREDLPTYELIEQASWFDQSILYQRLGFVMETLGMEHPELERWKAEEAQRGGSRLLDPEGEYSSTYSEEWALSINHPISILETEDTSYS